MLYQPQLFYESKIQKISTDICIIGSGAGGAIAAARLAKSGKSVLVLEEGPYVTREDFTQDEHILLPKLYRWSGALATDDLSMRILQGRAYGGSTTINWMTSLRPADFVLQEWADQGLDEYSSRNMDPHFSDIEKRLKVHAIPESDHNNHNRIILDGCRVLGIKSHTLNNNSNECIGCGHCGIGCSYDAKMDMRLTYLADALESNADIITGTRAERIVYHSRQKQEVLATVLCEEYGQYSNRPLRITTSRVVVAGGAIYTPILLQQSGLTKSKALGKFFHVHPVTLAVGRYDRDIFPSYGIPQSAVCDEYINLDGKGYGFWLEVPPVQVAMSGVNIPGIGESRRDLMQDLNKTGTIIVLVRDGANKKSSGSVRWTRGRPRIKYRLSSEDRKHLMMGLEKAIQIHFAAGAKTVTTTHFKETILRSPEDIPAIRRLQSGPNQMSLFSAHPQGTARMGSRRNKNVSVVNESLEMHHYPGIFVMDGSVLPTALNVNPMITILGVVSRGLELSDNLTS
ncbi:MAG TPA: GMC family oxidoreductase [Candidatus Hodarchaeales archaeon]|nr:GMC family oxidoreductase [Candidatus Hodarchaeales archaeon]